jgi:thioredoxin reductase (NADPH)
MKKQKIKKYDVAIIGAGPAGLMAAVYAGRYMLKAVVFGELHGGTISEANSVCNFPTYSEISGKDLSEKMVKQVKDINIPILAEKVNTIRKKGNLFTIKSDETVIIAKKIILAIGTRRRHLDLPNERELLGKGISYCSACDGFFFNDQIVGVVGGSDAALSAAIHLADIAKKVYIIYRKNRFKTGEPIWVNMALKNKKIYPIFNSNVKEFLGEKKLEGVRLDTGRTVPLNGLFIEIGSESKKEWLKELGIKTDKYGFVITNKTMNTNIHGIFSAGDMNSRNFKQAVVAAAEGAIAANSAYNEIKNEGK